MQDFIKGVENINQEVVKSTWPTISNQLILHKVCLCMSPLCVNAFIKSQLGRIFLSISRSNSSYMAFMYNLEVQLPLSLFQKGQTAQLNSWDTTTKYYTKYI